MGFWKLISPVDFHKNNYYNPSFEENATGWTTTLNNTVARSSDRAKFGSYSLKCSIVNQTAVANTNCNVDSNPNTGGGKYVFQAWVWLNDGWTSGDITLTLSGFTSGVAGGGENADGTKTGQWQLVWREYDIDAGDLYGSASFDCDTAVNGDIAYIDGVAFFWSPNGVPLTYVDGDQENCRWSATPHSSPSLRDVTIPGGGAIFDFENDLGLNIENTAGAGAPPISHLSGNRILLPGLEYQKSKINDRVITLYGTIIGSTMQNFHEQRNLLADVLAFDAGSNKKELMLRYIGEKVPKQIVVVYDGGMILNGPHGFSEKVQLRFRAIDWPLFQEIGNSIATLDSNDSMTQRGIMRKRFGVWSNASIDSITGLSGILAIAKSPNTNAVFVAGIFSDLDSITAADSIAYLNETADTWNHISYTSGAASTIFGIAIEPGTDDVYVVGTGTDIGGVGAADYIARWDGAAWNAVGTPLTGTASITQVSSVLIGFDGYVYIGGIFTDFANVAAADRVAYWDGTSWNAMGSGLNNSCDVVKQGKDGKIYIGGDFTTAGGTTVNRIAYWDGAAWNAMGDGFNGRVRDIEIAPNGDVYVAGDFTADGNGSGTFKRAARWNGNFWQQLGDGIDDGSVRGITHIDGKLYAGGTFTSVEGQAMDRIAVWNGTSWHRIDIEFSGTNTVYDISKANDALFIGTGTEQSVNYSGKTTITNLGSTGCWPVVKIYRSGGTSANIRHLANQTTGDEIELDYDLIDGETLTLDFRPGNRGMVSNMFGSRWKVFPGSDFGTFHLKPGDNDIFLFVDVGGSPTITATIEWTNNYLGID